MKRKFLGMSGAYIPLLTGDKHVVQAFLDEIVTKYRAISQQSDHKVLSHGDRTSVTSHKAIPKWVPRSNVICLLPYFRGKVVGEAGNTRESRRIKLK